MTKRNELFDRYFLIDYENVKYEGFKKLNIN